MSNTFSHKKIKKVLFIGSGPNDFGRESEHDAAIFQVMPELNQFGLEAYLIDENPYSLSLESLAAEVFWQPLTTENIKNIIHQEDIDTVIPLFGGDRALRIWTQVVQDWQKGDGPLPQTLGLSIEMMLKTVNVAAMTDYLAEAGLPVITNHVVHARDEANDLLRQVRLPLMIRALHPIVQNTRRIVERVDDFDEIFNQVKTQSLTQEVVFSRAINGLKEVSLQVMRDRRGNKLRVGASEDMDPIGIHTIDSLSISPVLTLQDQVLQKLRKYAFDIADLLQLEGTMHVQFAVDDDSGEIFIIKVSPYIDQMAMRTTLATGYPTILVAINLAIGVPLDEIRLPHYFHTKTAIMEPMMDHVVVKLPVFPFGELAESGVQVNRQLSSIQKSVGTVLGFGRTFIEALEKAIRSAHFNNASFSPTFMQGISDDELIQQLIHPQDNRVLLLIEAIKRGYEVDELAELTHIDEFYFYQLQRLLRLEESVEAAVDNIGALKNAKEHGLSDGLIARFWHTSFEIIRTLAQENQIDVTYKAVEPSAGEFPEHAHQYYATYEEENESTQVATDSILVIGNGAFRMGDSAASGYLMTTVLSELRRLQYHTVIMNNNPHDATLMPHLADKQYLEPLEISDIMKVVEVEQPKAIIVSGNRRKLIQALRDLEQNVLIMPKQKHVPSGPTTEQSEFALNFFFDGHDIYPLNITQHTVGKLRILKQKITAPIGIDPEQCPSPGVYQIIWYINDTEPMVSVNTQPIDHDTWLRPMPFGQVAFLNKAMQVQWIRLTVRAMLNRLTEEDYQLLSELNTKCQTQTQIKMIDAHVDYSLHLQSQNDIDSTRFEMGVSITDE